jgi:hypothetical protein
MPNQCEAIELKLFYQPDQIRRAILSAISLAT